MIESFLEYVNAFDLNNNTINRKKEHSLRVAALMKHYASLLGFNTDDISISYEIGLLHDIGRFRQVEQTNSLNDLEFDHADYGCKLLFKDGLINKFFIKESHYDILEFAIKNHNKHEIEKTSDTTKLKFAKLIRDIDKIDIFYLLSKKEIPKISDTSNITENVLDAIRRHQLVNTKDIITQNDNVACALAFVFEINYEVCKKELIDNFYAYYDTLENKDKFVEVINIINDYLKGDIK